MPQLPRFTSEKAFAATLIAAVVLSYFWVVVPTLSQYSTQLFALCLVAFLVLRRLSGARWAHVLPDQLSLDLLVLTIAFLVIIGATGALNSAFFPLSFLYFFALVFSSSPKVSIPTLGAVSVFLYATTTGFGLTEGMSLASLIGLFLLFLVGKVQYSKVTQTQILLEQETETLTIVEHTAGTLQEFLQGYLAPKLTALENLSQNNAATRDELASQVSLLKTEVEKLLKRAA